ncbi:class I SAM-dependent methyltransferase [Streptomyces sp. NPDC094448]|uniref:class I SAM-dependent methyltransferase n=1 Tax=Streptomyces sp. NPDC094448 TaxID=3366063 RepID=UPI0038098B78
MNLSGAVVAEIGGSFPASLLAENGLAKWYSIDPNREAGISESGIREVLAARAEDIPLPDESVDAVFSCNAFQFINVPEALAEIRRVLRPGGLLYTHFGPIWSAADGHQLEYVRYGDRDLAFWRDTLLPPWSHLSYPPEELRALLRSGLPEDLADLLVWHVHESDTVNRMFLEDYVAAALDSGLRWDTVAASAHLDYEIVPPRFDPALLREVTRADVAAAVSERRGRPTQIGARDVLMILQKDTAPAADPDV